MKLILGFLLLSTLLFAEPLKVDPSPTFRGGFVFITFKNDPQKPNHQLKIQGVVVQWMTCPDSLAGYSCAVAGIPIDDCPDHLEFKVDTGETTLATTLVNVTTKKTKVIELKVPPSHVEMSEPDKERHEAYRKELTAIYEKSSEVPLWKGKFVLPGKGGLTSRFGSGRSFNGKMVSTHYGLDLRANEKTWVTSSNAGRVVLAKGLFNPGNMVVVDHGQGIFTSYSHLSSFQVRVGEMVDKGQRLGRAGSTGRATGPHLHWAVRIRELFVDPEEFLKVFNNNTLSSKSRR